MQGVGRVQKARGGQPHPQGPSPVPTGIRTSPTTRLGNLLPHLGPEGNHPGLSLPREQQREAQDTVTPGLRVLHPLPPACGLSQMQSGGSVTSLSPHLTRLPGCINNPVIESLPCACSGAHKCALSHSLHHWPHLTDEEVQLRGAGTCLSLWPDWNHAPLPPTGSDSRLPHPTPPLALAVCPPSPVPQAYNRHPPSPFHSQNSLLPASSLSIQTRCFTAPPWFHVLCPSRATHQGIYSAPGLLATLALETVKWYGFASFLTNLILKPSQATFPECEPPRRALE